MSPTIHQLRIDTSIETKKEFFDEITKYYNDNDIKNPRDSERVFRLDLRDIKDMDNGTFIITDFSTNNDIPLHMKYLMSTKAEELLGYQIKNVDIIE